jgi:hypothetical protein
LGAEDVDPAHVFGAERIHADDTTVKVLTKLKTIAGRIWTWLVHRRLIEILPMTRLKLEILLALWCSCRRSSVLAKKPKKGSNCA